MLPLASSLVVRTAFTCHTYCDGPLTMVKLGPALRVLRRHVGQRLLLDRAVERQVLQRRVADRDAVAGLDVVPGHLRGLHLDAEVVAVLVDVAVLEAERAAHAGVGGVADADRVAVAAAGVAADVDRHAERLAVGLARQHLEVGEVLRVIERELRAQHLRQVVGIALVIAQVAAHQLVVDHVLLDGGDAEAVALAGVELEGDVGGVLRRVDHQLVASHLGVEVAVGGGGALQVGLERLVVGVVEPVAGVQRQVVQDALEQRVGLARAVDLHVDVLHQHRRAGGDVDDHAPVAVALVADGRNRPCGS